MQWEVKGADKTTGKDKVLRVTAESEFAAEKAAESHGLLVESVNVFEGGAQIPGPASPDPHRIGRIAETLSFCAGIANIIALLGILSGAGMILGSFRGDEPNFALMASGITTFLSGVFFLAMGASLKMLGAIGLTLRDMSR